MNSNEYYPYKALELSYDANALEPEISGYTVNFHYNDHYLKALNELNSLLKSNPLMQNIPLESLTKLAEESNLSNNAGSVYCHEMYFTSVSPDKTEPSDYLEARINADFGSLYDFYNSLENKAAELYGSGFTWLAENKSNRLELLNTPNHETPDFTRFKPIMALDLWEHSYYLDRQNNRPAYVDAFEKIIDWDNIETRLKTPPSDYVGI